jgi:hypothetical protein
MMEQMMRQQQAGKGGAPQGAIGAGAPQPDRRSSNSARHGARAQGFRQGGAFGLLPCLFVLQMKA